MFLFIIVVKYLIYFFISTIEHVLTFEAAFRIT